MTPEELQKIRDELGCNNYEPGPTMGHQHPVCMYFGTVTRRNNPQQIQKELKGYCTKDEFMCKIYFATMVMRIVDKIKSETAANKH